MDWGLVLGVIGVIGIPVATGIGMTMATQKRPEFDFARGCFYLAAALTVFSFFWLTNIIEMGFGKLISIVLVLPITLIALVFGLEWIRNREASTAAAAVPSELSVPLVSLLRTPGRLLFNNLNTPIIEIWGTKFGSSTASMESFGRLIPIGHHYYLLTSDLERSLLGQIGRNGDGDVPFEVYFKAADIEYTGRFILRVEIRNGVVDFHTQQITTDRGGWPLSKNLAT